MNSAAEPKVNTDPSPQPFPFGRGEGESSAGLWQTGLASKKRTQKLCNSLVSSFGFRSQ